MGACIQVDLLPGSLRASGRPRGIYVYHNANNAKESVSIMTNRSSPTATATASGMESGTLRARITENEPSFAYMAEMHLWSQATMFQMIT